MTLDEYQNYHEVKKHTDDRFPCNIYPCSIPESFSCIPLHWHDELEMIVIKKGEGIVSVDLRPFPVRGGDLVVILPGHLHAIEQSGTSRMEYENILCKPVFIADTAGNRSSFEDVLLPILEGRRPVPVRVTCRNDPDNVIFQLIRQIDALSDDRPFGYQMAVQGLMQQLFFHLANTKDTLSLSPPISTKAMRKLRTVLKYVEEHYPESVTVEQMAGLTFYSRSHFMKFFKQSMGCGFIEYVNDYRLTMAARMLRTDSKSVTDVAASCGFENLSHFHRLFKRKYNMTPNRYKAQASAQ